MPSGTSVGLVITSSSAFGDWSKGTLYFLIGQHGGGSQEKHLHILESIACEDIDVVEEQRECIEGVLAAGLSVLGFGQDGEPSGELLRSLRLRASPSAVKTRESVFVVKQGGAATARLLSDSSVEVSVTVEKKAVVWDAKCVVSKQSLSHPFVMKYVTAKGVLASVPLDPQNPRKLIPHTDADDGWRSCELVQLGAATSTAGKSHVQIPMAVCPQDVTGVWVVEAMGEYLSTGKPAREGFTIVQVKSQRPSGLVYACRVPRKCDATVTSGPTTLTVAEWGAVQNTIEDATGERVDAGLLIGAKVADEGVRAAEEGGMQEAAVGEGASSSVGKAAQDKPFPILLLLLALGIVGCAVLLVAGKESSR